MKKTGLISMFLIVAMAVAAQNPVTWSFNAKKLSGNSYKIHMTATIENGWHLYSQDQPEDAIAIPTAFTISGNPLISLIGKIKEIGKLEKFRDEKLDLSANQYSNKVEFVQVINLLGKVKTNFAGNVEYQTCDDKKCLPPKKVNFNVVLE